MSTTALVFLLEVVLLVATCLTVYKLVTTGLYRRYPVFLAYFLYRILYTSCVLLLDIKSNAYFYFWFFTNFLTWIFYALTVRELYSLVLERHRGLYTLGRWAMYLGLSISVTLSVVSLLPQFRTATPHSKIIGYVLATNRGVTLGLAIFIVLMLVLISQYSAVLSRNVVVHALIFAAFFLSITVSRLLQSVFGLKVYASVDTVLTCISAACVFCWFLLLKPEGEEVPAPVLALNPDHERRVLSQLDQLNETLLKSGRK